MSLRAFLALALTTLVAVVAVVVVTLSQRGGPAAREPGTPILPGLADSAASVDRIVMTRAGEKTTVKRTEGSGDSAKWVVEEFYGYPSHAQMVHDIIEGLASLQTLEPKTRRPDLYGKLDVDDPTNPEAKSTRLELFAGDKKIADLILGRIKSSIAGQESMYVRRPDEERAWLAKGKAEAPYNRIGWVNNQFLVVDLPRVKYATLNTPAKGPRVHVFKKNKDERDFTIEGMPPDYETKDIFAAEDVARVIQQLSFEDVRPADKMAIDTSAQPWAEFVTFDGLMIHLWLKEQDGKNWVAIRALPAPDAPPAVTAPPAPAAEDKAEADKTAESKDGSAKTDEAKSEDNGEKPRDVAAEIKEINERVTPWVYAIPAYENGNLRKTLDDLIQKKASDDKKPEEKSN
jgi:hypothetical protein